MRIPTLSAIALAALLATGGVAEAQVAGGGAGAPSVSPVTDFPLVKVDAKVFDAAGTTVKTLACEWTEPEDDDMPCIKFQGDPQTAFATIEEAGGVSAEKTTTLEDGSTTSVYSKRADGTWLIRTRGTVGGKDMHFGQVCTADGQKCQMWDVEGAKFARKSVRAAAAKLKSGKIDNSRKGR
ncbi:hypothetical protein DVA67_014900 [Solirubrobacter sp. CPCC 204708]|uniref:Uncharacterized protein n=1 Tax=Solirubrobacter deserti TaxID=2282478 RepID=A0ABT4RTZ0_9ACTN|nr:hypothetical protein [Solirubrobacter deserti]MBE2317268.1 hypothetical protein [Solirubrobacter deserti]MDA0142035.1 hypothetical protein [Solirubrobacter deserti]